MKRLTRKIAKEISLKKWNFLRKGKAIPNDFLLKFYFTTGCPLCELYICKECRKCPLNIYDETCNLSYSLYQKYIKSKGKKKLEYANKIYQIIKKWEI